VIILNLEKKVILSVNNGEDVTTISPHEIGPNISKLAQLSLDSDMIDPTPGIGTFWLGDSIYLVSISAITPFNSTERMNANNAYGLLLMAKPLNSDLLKQWQTAFHFNALQMHTKPTVLTDAFVSYSIQSPMQHWIADINWKPEQPGDHFLVQVLPWITTLFVLIIFISIIFVKRVQSYSKSTADALVELHESRKKLNTLAYYDPITELPNRSLFLDRLGQAVVANNRLGTQTGVLYIDLDGFKQVNDSKGHDIGDQLLHMVGQRMLECIRSEDTVSRIAGDEFCILLKDLSNTTDTDTIASKLQHKLNMPYMIEGDESFISSSIGIVISPNDGKAPEELLKKADIAMYQAKDNGRNCYQYYTQELSNLVEYKAVLHMQLRNALQKHELSLVYQPIVSASKKTIVGAEALLRWNNAKLGSVSPNEFIGLAESTGLIIPIGEWVLQTVFSDAIDFYSQYGDDFFISVNISGRQLSDKSFIDLVKELNSSRKQDTVIPKLHLEITESYLISSNNGVKDILNELSSLGFTIALDDFGTGYSSLSYLNGYPIHALKIDRSFIANFINDKKRKKTDSGNCRYVQKPIFNSYS